MTDLLVKSIITYRVLTVLYYEIFVTEFTNPTTGNVQFIIRDHYRAIWSEES